MIGIINSFHTKSCYTNNQKSNKNITFGYFKINDKDMVLRNFFEMSKDEALPKLEKLQNLMGNDNIFKKVYIVLKDSAQTVKEACQKVAGIRAEFDAVDFELGDLYRKELTKMEYRQKEEKFLESWVQEISGPADEISPQIQKSVETPKVADIRMTNIHGIKIEFTVPVKKEKDAEQKIASKSIRKSAKEIAEEHADDVHPHKEKFRQPNKQGTKRNNGADYSC